MPTRLQLSLFVPPPVGADLEAIRRVADPVQHRRIPAHVTLCREDELSGVGSEAVRARVAAVRCGPITLAFGPAERFGGHGILLPCVAGAAAFQALREVVLATGAARSHAPHLTLAHPRNPRAPGNDLGRTTHLGNGLRITFDAVQVIEQVDDAPWVVRAVVPLSG